MGVTPFNIIQGPAVLYTATFGTSFAPYIGADPHNNPVSSPFTDVGGTTGGITVEVDETLTDIHVDQLLDPVGARITARTIQVTTTLMESTLANLQLTLNGSSTGAIITNYTNANQLDLVTTTSATQPTYSTLIIDGWAPTSSTTGAPYRRRFIVQKALSQPKISQKYDMANQATIAVTWTAYYVSSSGAPGTGPFTIVDSTDGS